jgi:hypothetical protein
MAIVFWSSVLSLNPRANGEGFSADRLLILMWWG